MTSAVGPLLLDVVDAVLAYKAERGVNDQDAIRLLTDILDEAGSAYRVAEAWDGLEERVHPGRARRGPAHHRRRGSRGCGRVRRRPSRCGVAGGVRAGS
ncbi:hypothetical protein Shyd_69010 [Streptomyces hydrogenans]|uniref:Uncharacterized protein n=1 Tax=Streptomyces hydrogenans TaxID=1873719 RepID=A0ABQ3PKI5_9ACTN|nr:hypothetical protein [Streptomyces hydrogenans]GHI25530.1 hypothetical protein Shyd_69010 [Streptomyces hydrogenans]